MGPRRTHTSYLGGTRSHELLCRKPVQLRTPEDLGFIASPLTCKRTTWASLQSLWTSFRACVRTPPHCSGPRGWTGLDGLHARPANAPGPQQSGWLLSHPPHARRRLRTSCRQRAYCSLSSQWTSSQRRRHVHRFIRRRTEVDSHRGP